MEPDAIRGQVLHKEMNLLGFLKLCQADAHAYDTMQRFAAVLPTPFRSCLPSGQAKCLLKGGEEAAGGCSVFHLSSFFFFSTVTNENLQQHTQITVPAVRFLCFRSFPARCLSPLISLRCCWGAHNKVGIWSNTKQSSSKLSGIKHPDSTAQLVFK